MAFAPQERQNVTQAKERSDKIPLFVFQRCSALPEAMPLKALPENSPLFDTIKPAESFQRSLFYILTEN